MRFHLYIIFSLLITGAVSCSEKKESTSRHFYVSYETSNDSLKQFLQSFANNRAVYYDNPAKQFRNIAVEYASPNDTSVHFLHNETELPTMIPTNSFLYKVSIVDSLPLLHTQFRLRKFIYNGKEWTQASDQGFIPVTLLRYRFTTEQNLRRDVAIFITEIIGKDSFIK